MKAKVKAQIRSAPNPAKPAYYCATIKLDNEIIGLCSFWEDPNYPFVWWLGRPFVKKKLRNAGLGSKLVDAIWKYVKSKRGAKLCVLCSAGKKGFYLKNKFIEEGALSKHKLGKEKLFLMSRF